jgi:hypothetical protein
MDTRGDAIYSCLMTAASANPSIRPKNEPCAIPGQTLSIRCAADMPTRAIGLEQRDAKESRLDGWQFTALFNLEVRLVPAHGYCRTVS